MTSIMYAGKVCGAVLDILQDGNYTLLPAYIMCAYKKYFTMSTLVLITLPYSYAYCMYNDDVKRSSLTVLTR